MTPCIDVKTGKHLDVTVPEQIAAYRRMKEALLPMGEIVADARTECGAVLHLRPEYERGYRLMLISGENDAQRGTVSAAPWRSSGPPGGEGQARQGLLPAPRGRHHPAAAPRRPGR